jgi:mono/diheme cytochrome c family protein
VRFLLSFLLTSVLALAADRRPLLQQAPEKDADRANPYDGQDAAARAGYKLFQKECAACHGPSAEGRGRAPALASPAIRNASDGEIFWVLRNGSLKHGMPSFSHLPEQQRWQIVTYLKTLKQ